MARLRALIADDEPLARARLVRLLGQFPDIEIVADCALARLAGKAAPSSIDVNPAYIPGETF